MLPKGTRIVGAPRPQDEDREKRFIISPMRTGDSLGSIHFLEDGDQYESWVICNRYNESVWDFVYRGTTLNLTGYIVLPIDGPYQERQYSDLAVTFPTRLSHVRSYFSKIGTRVVVPIGPYLALFKLPLKHEVLRSPLPSPRITLQTGSVSTWKNYGELAKIDFKRVAKGFHLYNFVLHNEPVVPGATPLKNKSIMEVAATMLGARLHIGVFSSLIWLAPMLGTPAILCNASNGGRNWGITRFSISKTYGNDLRGSKDLFKPSAQEMENAIESALANS